MGSIVSIPLTCVQSHRKGLSIAGACQIDACLEVTTRLAAQCPFSIAGGDFEEGYVQSIIERIVSVEPWAPKWVAKMNLLVLAYSRSIGDLLAW